MPIKAILWDIDNTLLDFSYAERASLELALRTHALPCTDAIAADYSRINLEYWRALERGELTRAELRVRRFEDFFAAEAFPPELARPTADVYESLLGEQIRFVPGALETVNALRGRVRQYAASNGIISIQRRKLEKSGLAALLDGVFISGELGADKPSPAFFDAVLAALPGLDRGEILMVGDSLTSDVRGAVRYGLPTVWFNPKGAPLTVEEKPDWTIRKLEEVAPIVGINN